MKKGLFLLWLILVMTLLEGCSIIRIQEAERTPVDFSVVTGDDVPVEVQRLIEEKKETEFQFTFQSGEDMYLVKGYGCQMSGGYSIAVEELGASQNAVFLRTQLLGPKNLEQAGEPSWPCIVIKMKAVSLPIQFE